MADPVLSALEAQRALIMAELHDDTVQVLRACALRLGAAGADLPPPARSEVATVAEDLRLAADRMGDLLAGIRLPDLSGGIGAALTALATRVEADHGLRVDIVVGEGAPEPHEDAAITLYRVAQECLRNVVRHAHATSARVVFDASAGWHHLSVIDDGAGRSLVADDDLERPRLGWELMRQRTAALDGRIQIDTEGGHGTVVRLSLPQQAP